MQLSRESLEKLLLPRGHFRCPKCGSDGGRVAFWGYPPTEALTKDYFLAGCCIEMDPLTGRPYDRGCLECGHLWSSRRKRT